MEQFYFAFRGFPKEKQNLKDPNESTSIAGVGEWRKGEAKAVTKDTAEWLRATKRFDELDEAEGQKRLEEQRIAATSRPVPPKAQRTPARASASSVTTPPRSK